MRPSSEKPSNSLNGSSSLDLDNYDSVTGYRWDLNGDGQFVDGDPTMTIGPFSYPYQARVGLQVNDESFNSWSDPVYVDVFFAEQDLEVMSLEVEPFNLLDQNFTLSAIIENNATSVGIVRNQLVRFYDGNPFTVGTLLGGSGPAGLVPRYPECGHGDLADWRLGARGLHPGRSISAPAGMERGQQFGKF